MTRLSFYTSITLLNAYSSALASAALSTGDKSVISTQWTARHGEAGERAAAASSLHERNQSSADPPRGVAAPLSHVGRPLSITHTHTPSSAGYCSN